MKKIKHTHTPVLAQQKHAHTNIHTFLMKLAYIC